MSILAMLVCDRETNACRNHPDRKLRAHVEEREALKETMEPEGQGTAPADALVSVDKIIERMQESLCADDVKPSISDLMRLLELRRELAQTQPRPITVRWVDEWQQTPGEE